MQTGPPTTLCKGDVMKKMIVFLLLCLSAFAPSAECLDEKPVAYSDGTVTMKGYLVYDSALAGPRPGVLVVHEWWGHNEYARKRARMLAEMGYTALAVDMYGDGRQAMHPGDAGQFSSEVSQNIDLMKKRFDAALAFLKSQKTVDPKRVAAIGYCFGGGVVLQMVRQGADLKGVASFHGSLATTTPAQPGAVRAKIFVAHGAADSFISAAVVDAFRKEMKEAGADLLFIEYAGAQHSFTNPDADEYAKKFGIGVAYDREADEKSWKDLAFFLKGIFGGHHGAHH